MYSFRCLTILAVTCVLLSGCATPIDGSPTTGPNITTTQADQKTSSLLEAKSSRNKFGELVTNSDHIFIGEYLGDEEAEGWDKNFNSVFKIQSIQKAIPEWKDEHYRIINGDARLGPLVVGNYYLVFAIQIDSAVYPAIRRHAEAVLPLNDQMQIITDYLPENLLELYYPFILDEAMESDPVAAVMNSTGINLASPISGQLPAIKDTNDVTELIAVSDMVIRTTLEIEKVTDVSSIYNTDQDLVHVYKNKDNQKVPDQIFLPLSLDVKPGEEYILFLYWRHPENPIAYGLVARNGAVISKADADKWNQTIKLLS